jgi:hypothetical protein
MSHEHFQPVTCASSRMAAKGPNLGSQQDASTLEIMSSKVILHCFVHQAASPSWGPKYHKYRNTKIPQFIVCIRIG